MLKMLLPLALFPVLGTAEDAPTYLLKPFAPQPGQVLTIRSTSVSKDGKMTLQEGGKKSEGAMSVQRSRILEQRALDLAGSKALSYKIVEDTSVATSELGIPAKTTRTVSTLTGETAVGFQDPLKRWHLSLKGKNAFNAQAVELAELEAYANRRWFVNRPVAVGESWPIDPSFIRHLAVRDLGDVELDAIMTLEKVAEMNGIATAVLTFKLQTVGVRAPGAGQSAATGSINATGKVLVSLDTMLDRAFVLDGTMQTTARSGDVSTSIILPFSVEMQKTVASR